jgi:prevent-host-death family protein
MDVSVRELRNHTARVVSVIESGETVVLTVHGRPVADTVPRHERSERRSREVIIRDLEGIAERWRRAGVRGDLDEYDTGLTTRARTQDDDFEVLQELAPQLRVHRS